LLEPFASFGVDPLNGVRDRHLSCDIRDGRRRAAVLIPPPRKQRILLHVGEPATPPRIAPARAPPDWFEADFDQTDRTESEQAEPVPEFEFDQTVSWQPHRADASPPF